MAMKIPNGREIKPKIITRGLLKYTEIVIFGIKVYIPSGNPG
jgi:hypothetical protein